MAAWLPVGVVRTACVHISKGLALMLPDMYVIMHGCMYECTYVWCVYLYVYT